MAIVFQILGIVGHASAGAAQGIAGPDDQRKADVVGNGAGRFHGVGNAAVGNAQADAVHGLTEAIPGFGLFDGVQGGADEFHAEFFQDPLPGHFDGGVQPGLPAQGGQQGVGTLLFDDLGHGLRGDRLDVGAIRRFRVGHDGGRIGIHQHHLVAFFFQGLARLGAGIVELAGLADDDGAGADDQDFMDVRSFGHVIKRFSSCP